MIEKGKYCIEGEYDTITCTILDKYHASNIISSFNNLNSNWLINYQSKNKMVAN